MGAKSVEELRVYQKALVAGDEVSSILKVLLSQGDFRLKAQLGSSSSGVAALIAEGFGQSTDRFFAQYLYRARGESKETRTHLRTARGRDYLPEDEQLRLAGLYEEIEKMLTGLIRHLERENRRHRG